MTKPRQILSEISVDIWQTVTDFKRDFGRYLNKNNQIQAKLAQKSKKYWGGVSNEICKIRGEPRCTKLDVEEKK